MTWVMGDKKNEIEKKGLQLIDVQGNKKLLNVILKIIIKFNEFKCQIFFIKLLIKFLINIW